MNRRGVLGFSLALGMAGTLSASAQEFPSQTVPLAAAGSTDLVEGVIAEKMSDEPGQNVIVENVGGAGGNLGADRVARAELDGYPILMGTVATHALNPLS
jgi:tripartite-type tricarboxylate transporter receptor subunit TctC